jgi:hypothetical protein
VLHVLFCNQSKKKKLFLWNIHVSLKGLIISNCTTLSELNHAFSEIVNFTLINLAALSNFRMSGITTWTKCTQINWFCPPRFVHHIVIMSSIIIITTLYCILMSYHVHQWTCNYSILMLSICGIYKLLLGVDLNIYFKMSSACPIYDTIINNHLLVLPKCNGNLQYLQDYPSMANKPFSRNWKHGEYNYLVFTQILQLLCPCITQSTLDLVLK